MDQDWKFGGDDASITASIHDGRPGTAMMPFKDLITDEQIRQLVFYIREQAGLLKGKPETKVDPHGAIVKSEKQTVKLEVVGKDLETPWGIAFLPDGRMLITERPGRLRILDKGKLLPPVTGTPTVWVRQDGGLFDVEVHPQYAKNGWIYLSFSETLPGSQAPTPDRGRRCRSGPRRARRAAQPSVDDGHRARKDPRQCLGRPTGDLQRFGGSLFAGRTSTTDRGSYSIARVISSTRSATRVKSRAPRICPRPSARSTA